MKVKILTLFLILSCTASISQAKIEHLLPKPQHVTRLRGIPFGLSRQVRLVDPTGNAMLKAFVETQTAGLTDDAAAPTITVRIVEEIEDAYDYELAGYPAEAYQLEVQQNSVVILALDNVGVVRATQTLTQLAEGYEGDAEQLRRTQKGNRPSGTF